jgi:hypothetical protein
MMTAGAGNFNISGVSDSRHKVYRTTLTSLGPLGSPGGKTVPRPPAGLAAGSANEAIL